MSGLSRTPGKRVQVNNLSGVRIPLSPPASSDHVKTKTTLLSNKPISLIAGIGLLISIANAQVLFSSEAKALPIVNLSIGGHLVKAEIAENDTDCARGLMFRTFLKPDDGMLFVFNQTGEHCFWMRNTKIPLSIAFINASGVIVNIDEMQPETLDKHCPEKPVRYALEMNSKWYASKGIKSGVKIDGLPGL